MISNHQATKPPRFVGNFLAVSPEIDRIAKEIVDGAFEVHSTLGPGLLEFVYEICLAHELTKRGLKFQTQIVFPIVYDGSANHFMISTTRTPRHEDFLTTWCLCALVV
jgi:hypothetical protein